MTIYAKVIADSINPSGKRLTTLEIKIPKWLIQEFNTHRSFSRNFRSARAVPTKVLIEEVKNNPYIPKEFVANKRGMQGGESLDPTIQAECKAAWLISSMAATKEAEFLSNSGSHKQHANRLLEPFAWAYGVVTATEWDNFFKLRDSDQAQPEIRELAQAMKREMAGSKPKKLYPGDMHAPYIEGGIPFSDNINSLEMVSAARCARVSYKPFDKDKANIEDDIRLAEDLLKSGHLSPFEHPCTPLPVNLRCHNLIGWCSSRAMLEERQGV